MKVYFIELHGKITDVNFEEKILIETHENIDFLPEDC